MFVKLMGAFPGYIYATDAAALYVNLYAGSAARATVAGTHVTLTQTTRYPCAADLRAEHRPDLLGGVTVLRAAALASFAGAPAPRPVELTAIPYYANANRGPVSMCVWVPRSPADAHPASLAESATPAASHCNRS